MARLGSIALIALSLPAAAWGDPPPPESNRAPRYQLPRPDERRFEPSGRLGRTEIAPNTHFGFGMFGLKPDVTHLQRVTGREINAPKQRRAAVGFSLKF